MVTFLESAKHWCELVKSHTGRHDAQRVLFRHALGYIEAFEIDLIYMEDFYDHI